MSIMNGGVNLDYIKQLEDVIVKLRMSLKRYAQEDFGWQEVEDADAYEESKELVPLRKYEYEN